MSDDLFTDEVVKSLREENQERRNTPTGTRCRVCDQKCKTYHRPMYGTQARRLLALFRKTKGQTHTAFHVRDFIAESSSDGGFALLLHWGLTWAGRERGWWGITEKGVAFVSGKIRVPRKAIFYNDTLLGFDEEDSIAIKDVLPEPFDLEELMSV